LKSIHWDINEQRNAIWKPTFTNILDPEKMLVPDIEKFKNYYGWFMKQFEMPNHNFDQKWKIGSDLEDIENKFFFLDVNFDLDFGQAAVQGIDEYPHPVETKFDKLVFEIKTNEFEEIEDSNGNKEYR
jgi:hypothetical protein